MDLAPEIVWQPQTGPQKALIDCPIPEILYGGARGGGKTDGILGKYSIKAEIYGSVFNAVFFRREMPQQDDLIERAKEIYLPLDAEWQDQKKTFRFARGGRVRFRPLESIADAEKYQGQNLTDAAVEEAGNYPDPGPIDRLHGAMRSAAGVPTQLILTANPGGAGHHWIKRRYVDPAPGGMKILKRALPDGSEHRYVFIPSKVENNRILLAKDPGYKSRLFLVGSEALVKAWLEGDWSVIEGAYFDCWSSAKHVIAPFAVPPHWTRIMSMDWGSAKPFSVGWWAVSDGSLLTGGRHFPAGAMIRYREWYGSSSPNVGIKLTAEQLADGIKLREGGDKINARIADPSCWKVDGGPSIAERMMGRGVVMMQADNSRITGWDQVRARLIGDDAPMIFCFSTCTDSIRTIPALQHDKIRAEDLDTDGEDHCADEWRYACMSRPYTRKAPKPLLAVDAIPTFADALKLHDRQRIDRRERI
jgi:hypothetical protein